MRLIWVAPPPGQICSKPESGPRRLFDANGEQVEETAQILRLLHQGDLIEVQPPAEGGKE